MLIKGSPILAVVRVPEHAVFVGIQADAVKLVNTRFITSILVIR
jgi:hypothetical protein